MKIIAGIESPDSGRVTRSNSAHIGILSQIDYADPESTVRDVVLGDTATHEWASDAGIREVFTGLFGGFDDHLFERKFESLSGGEKRRVGLAKLLIANLDLILLDEPTEHLDHQLAERLEMRIAEECRDKSLIVITHSGWAKSTRTVAIERE